MRKPREKAVIADWDRFPPEHAFVVQLTASEDGAKPSSGRVEHVLSGHSTRFESLEGLALFFGAELARIRAAARKE